MNGLQYKTERQSRSRAKVGRAIAYSHGTVSNVPGADFQNIIHATKALTAFSINAGTQEDCRLAGGVLRVIAPKIAKRVRRRQKARATKNMNSDAMGQGSSRRHTVLLTVLVQKSMDFATVKSQEVRELVADDGTRYPLRVPLDIAKRVVGGSSRFFFLHSDALNSLAGEDADEKAALGNFAEAFHRMVVKHWKKPPHLHRDEDEEINRVLGYLVDWDRYREVNPVEQPLWGQVIESLDNGDIRVNWVIGPNDKRGVTTIVRSKDVCSGLREIPTGNWFYGSGKVFPTRIEWIDQPNEVPDPHNRDAIREAWDLIPRHVISAADAWPLKDMG